MAGMITNDGTFGLYFSREKSLKIFGQCLMNDPHHHFWTDPTNKIKIKSKLE